MKVPHPVHEPDIKRVHPQVTVNTNTKDQPNIATRSLLLFLLSAFGLARGILALLILVPFHHGGYAVGIYGRGLAEEKITSVHFPCGISP